MDASTTLQLLLEARRLKCTPRTGWMMRGVTAAESVADHSFGVAFISLILAELVEPPLDKAKLLTIALLHDLPESVIGDLPTPATARLSPQTKRKAEEDILDEMLSWLPCAEQWHTWWKEFEDRSSPEGRLVHDADQLDMLLQAYVYEQTTGNRWLEEFWPRSEPLPFEFDAARALYEELRALRKRYG